MVVSRHAVATWVCIVAALTGARPALANDTTVTCKSPPTESASVAVHPGTQVTFTQDTTNKTCTFSINGAVATSPPAEKVMSALNLFRGQQPPFNDINTMAPAIAALLAAPAQVDTVPDDLVLLLAKPDTQLTRCLSEFFYKKALPSIEPKEMRFSCKGLGPYKDAKEKAQHIAKGEPAVGVPTLMISVVWQEGRFFSALFLPLTIVELPPIR